MFVRSFKGRKFDGMESQVLRPIMRAFVVLAGARFVMRAKYAISFLSPLHGRELFMPIPIWFVAATIRVSSRGNMIEVL